MLSINEISIYEDNYEDSKIYKFGVTYNQYCDLRSQGYIDEILKFFYKESLKRHNCEYEYFLSIRKRFSDVSNDEFCEFIDNEIWNNDEICEFIDTEIWK